MAKNSSCFMFINIFKTQHW